MMLSKLKNMYVGDRIRYLYIDSYINEVESGKCLDIGAGMGIYKPLIEGKGFSYAGIDVNPNSPFPIIKGSATHIPFEDGSFDCFICVDVLEHIEDDKKVVSEMFRVLKKGGKGIIHVPNKNQTHILVDPVEQDDHVRKGYDKSELKGLFNKFSYVMIKPTFNVLECIAWEIYYAHRNHLNIDVDMLLRFDVNSYKNLGWLIEVEK